ncbi:MAG: hypothetical protein FWE85_03975 [Clostridiales bacterium]|nr:hypothetical protein [Clostridiales bacterium]
MQDKQALIKTVIIAAAIIAAAFILKDGLRYIGEAINAGLIHIGNSVQGLY